MLKYIIASSLLLCALTCRAEIYENKSGTAFSDTPTPGASPVDIPDNAANSMPPLQALKALKTPAKVQSGYHIVSGTGFFVTKSYVVTNAHVLKGGCDKIIIKGAVPERAVTLKVMDTDHDLALLETSHPPQHYAPLRFNLDDLKVGDKVYILGFPGPEGLHGEYHFAQAQIVDLGGGRNRHGRFYITDVLLHGNSGGPVLDNTGNVIGVVVATSTFSRGNDKVDVGVVISLTTLKEFLTANYIYGDWMTSHLSYDEDSIEDNAKDYIVAVQCRTLKTS